MIRQLAMVLVFGGCSLGLIAVGCGGSGGSGSEGPAFTLEQYFAQLQAADSLASSRIDRIGSELDETRPEAQALQALKDVFPEQIATLDDLVESMETLRPPAEVKHAHDAAIDALKNSIDVTKRNSDAIQDAASLQEASDILASQETTEADQATSQMCLALEKAGTDRGITVDLDC